TPRSLAAFDFLPLSVSGRGPGGGVKTAAGRKPLPLTPPETERGNKTDSTGDSQMALDLTAEQKELGKGNANAAAYDLTRRGFMKSAAIGAAGFGTVAVATYFGYEA